MSNNVSIWTKWLKASDRQPKLERFGLSLFFRFVERNKSMVLSAFPFTFVIKWSLPFTKKTCIVCPSLDSVSAFWIMIVLHFEILRLLQPFSLYSIEYEIKCINQSYRLLLVKIRFLFIKCCNIFRYSQIDLEISSKFSHRKLKWKETKLVWMLSLCFCYP